MKKIYALVVVLLIATYSIMAQEMILTAEKLNKLDASWEKALLEVDLDFLEATVAKDFIWVHNHASRFDNKKSLLESRQKYVATHTRHSKSRIQKDIKTIISGATGIVTGFTDVIRINETKTTTYNFMRTYIVKDGKIYLIANHTMAVPLKK